MPASAPEPYAICRLFPRTSRITKGTEIRRVLKNGKRSLDRLFTVYALANDRSHARLAVAVSRRVSPRAVDRNRIKRLIRESFRHVQGLLPAVDVVVVALPATRAAEHSQMRTALEAHWLKLQTRCAP